jgi:hypothetical protein
MLHALAKTEGLDVGGCWQLAQLKVASHNLNLLAGMAAVHSGVWALDGGALCTSVQLFKLALSQRGRKCSFLSATKDRHCY